MAFCIGHCSHNVVLCAIFEKDVLPKTDVMGGRNFAQFQFYSYWRTLGIVSERCCRVHILQMNTTVGCGMINLYANMIWVDFLPLWVLNKMTANVHFTCTLFNGNVSFVNKISDALMQDDSNSIANVLDLLQSCIQPSIYFRGSSPQYVS